MVRHDPARPGGRSREIRAATGPMRPAIGARPTAVGPIAVGDRERPSGARTRAWRDRLGHARPAVQLGALVARLRALGPKTPPAERPLPHRDGGALAGVGPKGYYRPHLPQYVQ